jgi:flavodoxin
MKKYLVLYYSKTGNSKFLAEQIAQALPGDIREITCSVNSIGMLFLISLLKWGVRINISKQDLSNYEEVVILGPIWGGTLIAPLRSIIKKCRKASKVMHFAVSCETSEAEKDDKFGYEQVLEKARALGGSLMKTTAAFSMALVEGGDVKTIKLEEKIKVTAENYKGEIKSRVEDFIRRVKSVTVVDGI